MTRLRLPRLEHCLCGEVSDDGYDDDSRCYCFLTWACNICIFVTLLPVEIALALRGCFSNAKERRRAQIERVKPLPLKRKRNLSTSSMRTPLQVEERGSRQSTTTRIKHRLQGRTRMSALDQSSSPLFKLSPELRMMIYREVLGGYRFDMYIVKPLQRQGELPFAVVVYKADPSREWDTQYRYSRNRHHDCHLRPTLPDKQFLALLKSCQKMYVYISPGIKMEVLGASPPGPWFSIFKTLCPDNRSRYQEAIDILYSKNSFRFDHFQTILDFRSLVLPQRWSSITLIQFEHTARSNYPYTGPPSVGAALSPIESLRELQIWFETIPSTRWAEPNRAYCEHTWMEAIRALREHPVMITMEISWSDVSLQAAREREQLRNLRIVSTIN